MANKKKIEARAESRQRAQRIRNVQIASAGVILLALVAGIWFLSPKKAKEPKQYNAYPAMTIDTTKQYYATFKMENGGEFVAQLYADKAPKTVNSFVFLARDGFYDGVTFHRVIDQFMAQGGDPTGTGMGGPGYSFEDEIDPSLTFDAPGVLAMANSGPNTNGSQFFITYAPTPHLNGLHTIFGQVIEGMDVVNSLTRRDPNQAPTYAGDAIKTIEISEQ